jgi:hypothetical protein
MGYVGLQNKQSKKHDEVDTTTQALNYFRGSGPSGIFLYYQEAAAEAEKEAAAEAEREQTKAQVPG